DRVAALARRDDLVAARSFEHYPSPIRPAQRDDARRPGDRLGEPLRHVATPALLAIGDPGEPSHELSMGVRPALAPEHRGRAPERATRDEGALRRFPPPRDVRCLVRPRIEADDRADATNDQDIVDRDRAGESVL